MRIFNYIIFFNLLMSQEEKIKILSYDKKLISDTLNFYLDTENNLNTYFQIDSIILYPKTVIYEKKREEKKIDSVFLKNNVIMAETINNQFLTYYKNKHLNTNFEDIGRIMVSRYHFLDIPPSTNLSIYNKNKIALEIDLLSRFTNTTSAIFGINKNSKSWNLNGEFNLHIENYIKQAEVFIINWKKIDSLSQKLNFDILFPHPFGSNTGIHWKYNFETVNGMYIKEKKEYSLKSFFPIINNFELGYVIGSTSPTNAGKQSDYKKSTFQAFLLKITKDNRNKRFLATNGSFFSNEINIGLQNRSSYFDFHSNYYLYKLFKNNFLINFKYKSERIIALQGETPKSRYKSYGGAKSLRGYDENQFFSDQYNIFCLESGYNINNTFQIKSFIDYSSNKLFSIDNPKVGYGFGFYQITNKYIIEAEYALNNFNPTGGKVHFKLVSKF